MNPAYPVIVFSTATGAGYGLLVLLGVFSASEALPAGPWFAVVAFGLALGAIGFGLLAATVRPGHPERAWRPYAQWRTNWRSRAAVLAIATYVAAALFAFGWIVLGRTDGPWRALGLATALLAGLTVYANGMIHVAHQPPNAMQNRWVVPNCLALALLTGALWLNALVNLFGRPSPDLAMVVVIAVFLAFYLKRRYWRTFDATPGLSTGLGAYREAPPHDPIAPREVRNLRRWAFLGLFPVPLLLSMAAIEAAPAAAIAETVAAALSASAGLIVERRLFFAEASHGATLYGSTETA